MFAQILLTIGCGALGGGLMALAVHGGLALLDRIAPAPRFPRIGHEG